MTPEQVAASDFMEFCSKLPGFKKADFEPVERGILAGNYKYDATEHVVTTADGWRIQIFEDGRFVPVPDES
jgi:hypothetical protein